MAKEKTTITVDRSKVDAVRALTGAGSTSAAIDAALSQLLRSERIRRDVAAYTAGEPTDEELAWAHLPQTGADLADDTDWAALYEDELDASP